ncbi:Hypothetical protein PHPALM_18799 [Phytophthora palmivora]|uniref:Uncharacterized protein n=1 Tax=Phytophthora palmivora TaxID=4796 RepID=A0A2P4XIU4_9STRA|nr:Hypothetical protein PHPALM_18799 [Phytophthora palmivora]
MHSMNIIRIKTSLTLLYVTKDHEVQFVRRWQRIDEIAQTMRARAHARRETTPSTIVLSVEEYKAKMQRKNPIQPHEILKGALSRGTFGEVLSRDRFHDFARFLHFNDNAKQADSGDRAFKIRPVIHAL